MTDYGHALIPQDRPLTNLVRVIRRHPWRLVEVAAVAIGLVLVPLVGPAPLAAIVFMGIVSETPALIQRVVASTGPSRDELSQIFGKNFDLTKIDPETAQRTDVLLRAVTDLMETDPQAARRMLRVALTSAIEEIGQATGGGPKGSAPAFDAWFKQMVNGKLIPAGLASDAAQQRLAEHPNDEAERTALTARFNLPAASGKGVERGRPGIVDNGLT